MILYLYLVALAAGFEFKPDANDLATKAVHTSCQQLYIGSYKYQVDPYEIYRRQGQFIVGYCTYGGPGSTKRRWTQIPVDQCIGWYNAPPGSLVGQKGYVQASALVVWSKCFSFLLVHYER